MTAEAIQKAELNIIKLAAIVFAAGMAYQRLDDIGDRVGKIEARLEVMAARYNNLKGRELFREFGDQDSPSPKGKAVILHTAF